MNGHDIITEMWTPDEFAARLREARTRWGSTATAAPVTVYAARRRNGGR